MKRHSFVSRAAMLLVMMPTTATAWGQEIGGGGYTLTLYPNYLGADAINATYLDGVAQNVTLNGRTLYKDDAWNTLCLPFDVTIANSPLAGATVKKLTTSTSNLTDGTLTLNFDGDGNEVNGIVEAVANSTLYTLNSKLSEWYTLDGRKLSGKPAKAGLYIHGNRKVSIK